MKIGIYKCQLVREAYASYRYGHVKSTHEAKRIVLEVTKELLENAPQEHFLVLTCDTKLKPIALHIITVGTLDASLVHPREIFRVAFLDNASSILLIHNHPSGEVTPSSQDHEVTERTKKAGELLGVQVLDHIIVGHSDGNWQAWSLAEGY